jgi:hypothetical protein
MTVGKGNPSAWQCNAAVCPATTLVSLGSITHSGGTEINQTHLHHIYQILQKRFHKNISQSQ